METSSRHVIAPGQRAVIEPALEAINPPRTALHDLEAYSDASLTPEIVQRGRKDPHGLRDGAPLAFAAYRVAIDCHPALLKCTLGEEAVLDRLRKLAPRSAFQIDYVTRQTFKFINPHGHGANSSRFSNETLGWFRQEFPSDSHLTAGLILLLCAARWWTHEQGERSITPRMNPLTTSDLDRKLKSFGFLSGERQAICRMLRREPCQR